MKNKKNSYRQKTRFCTLALYKCVTPDLDDGYYIIINGPIIHQRSAQDRGLQNNMDATLVLTLHPSYLSHSCLKFVSPPASIISIQQKYLIQSQNLPKFVSIASYIFHISVTTSCSSCLVTSYQLLSLY